MGKKFSIADRVKSFKYAFAGLFNALKTEHNLWIHLAATAVVVFLGFDFFRLGCSEIIINELYVFDKIYGFRPNQAVILQQFSRFGNFISLFCDNKYFICD